METKKKEKTTFSLWHVILIGAMFATFDRMHREGNNPLKKFWNWLRNDAPAAAQQNPKQPGLPLPTRPAPNGSAKSKYLPEIDRLTGIHLPKPNQNGAAPQSPVASVASETNTAKPQNKPEYSQEFNAEWGIDGDSEFAKLYEENYKAETGIGFNDAQRAYVKDVVAQDYKARLHRVFVALGNSIPDDKADQAFAAVSEEMANDTGPIHQAKLLAMMDGRQVAMLSSFLSGINVASQESGPMGEYSPAFQYLWSGGEGDEFVVANTVKFFESGGIAMNTSQKDYIKNTLVPHWKSKSAEAFEKLDLSSGKVTGSEVQAALTESMFKSIKTHMDKLDSMMDSNQRQILDLRNQLERSVKE